MNSLITTSRAFSRRSSGQYTLIDRAVLAKTKEAKALLRLYLIHELTFTQLQLAWKHLQLELNQLGYGLHLLRDEDGSLCLEVQKIDLKPLPEDLRFCFSCTETATKLFCERWWCAECFGSFLKEVL